MTERPHVITVDLGTMIIGLAAIPASGSPVVTESHCICNKKAPRAERFAKLQSVLQVRIDALLRQMSPSPAVVVGYATPFARGADATRCLWGAAGILEAVAVSAGCATVPVSENSVRSHFQIKSHRDKGQRSKDLKAQTRNVLLQRGLTTGSQDAADALLLALYLREVWK